MVSRRASLARALTLAVLASCSSAPAATIELSALAPHPGPVHIETSRVGGDDGWAPTTTTTPPPVATTTTVVHHAAPSSSSGSGTAPGFVNGTPCGGDLPACCVIKRESGGSWTALNPKIIDGEEWGAGGWAQILVSTWEAWGGEQYAPAAHLASPAAQEAIARKIWAAAPSNWAYPRCW